jgi:hypothetical protein
MMVFLPKCTVSLALYLVSDTWLAYMLLFGLLERYYVPERKQRANIFSNKRKNNATPFSKIPN